MFNGVLRWLTRWRYLKARCRQPGWQYGASGVDRRFELLEPRVLLTATGDMDRVEALSTVDAFERRTLTSDSVATVFFSPVTAIGSGISLGNPLIAGEVGQPIEIGIWVTAPFGMTINGLSLDIDETTGILSADSLTFLEGDPIQRWNFTQAWTLDATATVLVDDSNTFGGLGGTNGLDGGFFRGLDKNFDDAVNPSQGAFLYAILTVTPVAEGSTDLFFNVGRSLIGYFPDDETTIHFGVGDEPVSRMIGGTQSLLADATIVVGTPDAPSVDLLESSDSGRSHQDDVTNDRTPSVQVSAMRGSWVRLFVDGIEIDAATAVTNAVDFQLGVLSDGPYLIGATLEVDGHISDASNPLHLTVDTVAPLPPSNLSLTDSSDTGVSQNDEITKEATPTIEGQAEDQALVILRKDGAVAGQTFADGLWAITGPSLVDGTYAFTAEAEDVAGNRSGFSAPLTSIIDTAFPTVTVDASVTPDATPVLAGGINDSRAAVVIMVDGQTRTAINTGDRWQLADNSLSGLSPGIYDVVATATDVAGNVSTDVTTNELTIQLAGPMVTIDPLLTNDPNPILMGTIDDPVATIQVSVSGHTYNAVNQGNGTWLLADDMLQPPLGDGIYDVVVTATDMGGVEGMDRTTGELIIDSTAPVVTIDTLLTNDSAPPIGGAIDDADTLVAVTVAGQQHGAVNHGDGTWLLTDDTINPMLIDGSYDVTVAATDLAGNVGFDSTIDELTIDTVAPTVTVDELLTDDPTPALSGTVDDPSATITVTTVGQSHTATNHGDGTWVLADNMIDPPLPDGSHDVMVMASDLARNTGFDASVDELALDAVVPTVTVDRLVTNDTTPQLTGTLNDPSATVTVVVGGQTYVATVNGDGTWTLADNAINLPLAEGTFDVAITSEDAAGNVATEATSGELVIETLPPVVTVDVLLTTDSTPVITGTIDDPEAAIGLELDRLILVATNNGDGTWQLPSGSVAASLVDGVYDVVATATDLAGNQGTDATLDELTIDTTPPSAVLTGPADADGDQEATTTADVSRFEVTFSEAIAPSTLTDARITVTHDDTLLQNGIDYVWDLSLNPLLSFTSTTNNFAVGTYRISISGEVSDPAGNPLVDPVYAVHVGFDVLLGNGAAKRLSFIDAHGSKGTVLISKGQGLVGFVGGSLAMEQGRKGPVVTGTGLQIHKIKLIQTDPKKTSVVVKSKDGINIGSITGGGAKSIDLKGSDLIGNSVILDGPLGRLRVDDIHKGSRIELGGELDDQFTLQATGVIGEPGATHGVDLFFPGKVKAIVTEAWHGGRWTVGQINKVTTKNGDFSPSVEIGFGFKSIDVKGGDFRSPSFSSGTVGDGTGGKIRARAGRDGHGGAIVSSNAIEINGNLALFEDRSIDARLVVAGEVKRIRQRDKTGLGLVTGDFVAKRIGKFEAQSGDAEFNITTTGTAEELGRKAAIDTILLRGANWRGGQVLTQAGTRIKQINLKARKGFGGDVTGPVNVLADVLDKLRTGDMHSNHALSGDLKSAKVGRIIGSTFSIGGDLIKRLSTKSQVDELVDPNGLDDGSLELVNTDGNANGILSVAGSVRFSQVKTG